MISHPPTPEFARSPLGAVAHYSWCPWNLRPPVRGRGLCLH